MTPLGGMMPGGWVRQCGVRQELLSRPVHVKSSIQRDVVLRVLQWGVTPLLDNHPQNEYYFKVRHSLVLAFPTRTRTAKMRISVKKDNSKMLETSEKNWAPVPPERS